MHTHVENIINFRNCAYSFNGTNIANMRRSELQPLAQALGLRGDFSKNQLLTMMITKLDAIGASKELSEHWSTPSETAS